jgi:hypothetical protein
VVYVSKELMTLASSEIHLKHVQTSGNTFFLVTKPFFDVCKPSAVGYYHDQDFLTARQPVRTEVRKADNRHSPARAFQKYEICQPGEPNIPSVLSCNNSTFPKRNHIPLLIVPAGIYSASLPCADQDMTCHLLNQYNCCKQHKWPDPQHWKHMVRP